MALVKYNNNSISAVTSASSIPSGALTHIKTLTASSSATLSFVHGTDGVVLDSTYPIYKFEFINIHPATDSQHLKVNFRDGSTAYDATKTTTAFYAYHNEAGTSTGLTYLAGLDLAQSTAAQSISGTVGNGNDESTSGEIFLFNPSSTTFVKNFIVRGNTYSSNDLSADMYFAGYCNVTAAIDAVQFTFGSGNIDSGKIKLYGIKDS